MSGLTILQKNGITNMVCKNEDCHTPETNCPCTIIDQCECPTLKEVIETLAHYKDLEEQGRLIVQKQGQWIHEDVDWVCSECGEDAPTIPFKGKQYRANYCSNCGAKMGQVVD